MEPEHFRLSNFWVQWSYDFYYNFLSYFWCYITISSEKTFYSSLFQTHKTFEFFFSTFSKSKKWTTSFFYNLESSSRPISDFFFFIWEVFLIDFRSKMKSQKAWKGFGVISKQLFFTHFAHCSIQCAPSPPTRLFARRRCVIQYAHHFENRVFWHIYKNITPQASVFSERKKN